MAYRALQLCRCILRWIRLDTCRRRGVCSPILIRNSKGFATIGGSLGKAAARDIPITFQDLLCGDFGILFEKVGIRENRLQILRDLDYSKLIYLYL